MSEKLRFLDLFSGIGGFRLGMEMAGHICVGHCEIDKYADMSYRAMHDVKGDEWYADDITRIKPAELPEAECYCFGFPCQSFSIAGKRGGFEDTRGTLFFEVMRLAKKRHPRILFAENVKGLLNHEGGRTFGTILTTMDALGYDVEWQLHNSKYWVPQNRERVFIVGHLRGTSGRKIFPIREGFRAIDHIQGLEVNTITARSGGAVTTGSYIIESEQHEEEPFVKQVGNIVDDSGINFKNPQRGRIYSPEGISPSLNICGGGGLEPKIMLYGYTNKSKTNDRNRVLAATGISQALRATDYKSPVKVAIPVLSPDRITKRQNGRRFKLNGEPMYTLTAQDKHGVLINLAGGSDSLVGGLYTDTSKRFERPPTAELSRTLKAQKHDAAVTDGTTIRKLIPKEAFRLQGFPDIYFYRAEFLDKHLAAFFMDLLPYLSFEESSSIENKEQKMSNSQLYKQIGNSVTVPVVYEIAKRLE